MKNFCTAFFAVFMLVTVGCGDGAESSANATLQDTVTDVSDVTVVSDVAEATDVTEVSVDTTSLEDASQADAPVEVEDVVTATDDTVSDTGVSVDGDNNESDQGE